VIQKSLALLQIMSCSAMDLIPLFCIVGTPEGSLFLLIQGLLVAISTVSSILAISPVSCIDLPVILFPLGPLTPGFQKLSPGFRSLYAHIGDCE
jgi:hypothetical protein